ncbi:MAG: CapA family protein [Prevotella sp.]|nr:CapA family protein [Prevotella sp.]
MRVLIAGDFAPSARLAHQIEEERYSDIFPKNLRTVIKSADFSFVNFESAIADSECHPILKCGPNLKCSPKAADAICYAGFTGVTMANNHILDYGPEGLKHSVECCKNLGLNVVGVGDNLMEANNVLYLKKNGKTLAIINCCEHEFSIATETSPGANPLNPINQYYAIQKAKAKADYILVIVHGGHEHFQLPSLRRQQTYRFFVDAGADAVVNHHQHCYSGYEVYNGKPIFYGIGNFCFDKVPIKKDNPWNFGFLVEIIFEEKISYRLYPYNQFGKSPTVELLSDDYFVNDIAELNDIILKSELLKSKVSEYYSKCKDFELNCIEPYSSRIANKLYSMGLLPSFIKGAKARFVLNHIECESHRDKLVMALKSIK